MSYFSKSSTAISLVDTQKEFEKLKRQLHDLLYRLGDDGGNIASSRDLDERFLIGQYRGLAENLDDIHRKLEYLSKDVISEGPIFHNSAGRYEMLNGDYFTSGSRIELLVEDDDEDEDERTYWVLTTIEHNGDDYYAVALGREASINGMTARLRR
ncbi:DUF5348 domain-containing protein [Planomicrobium okeanokoites]|uniref:DUF5348 domain-containing protein n=1 Tax=Planomicrobium okeanokoites TaxID=244 RepID=UPI003564C4E5